VGEPDIAAARIAIANLGGAYHDQWKYGQADVLHSQTLEIAGVFSVWSIERRSPPWPN